VASCAQRALDAYRDRVAASGRDAARRPNVPGEPASVVLVEGVSDQIAIEVLARAQGRDLEAHGVAVVPMGGAHAIGNFLARFGPAGAGLPVIGLCDAGEERAVRRVAVRAGVDMPLFVCRADLEDELIRAVTPGGVQAVLDANGDLDAFRTLQKQPAWRHGPVQAQLRRFLGSAAAREVRYAEALTGAAAALGRAPAPLQSVLDAATWPPRRQGKR
jgi:hypothetical protein